jgi:hypothetical protein
MSKSAIPVPQRLRSPHAYVGASRDATAGLRSAPDGRLELRPRKGVVRLAVSRRQLPRALRILQGLFAEAERRGWRVEPVERSYGDATGVAVAIERQSYRVLVSEQTDRVPLTEAEVARWRRDNEWPPRERKLGSRNARRRRRGDGDPLVVHSRRLPGHLAGDRPQRGGRCRDAVDSDPPQAAAPSQPLPGGTARWAADRERHRRSVRSALGDASGSAARSPTETASQSTRPPFTSTRRPEAAPRALRPLDWFTPTGGGGSVIWHGQPEAA